MAYLHRNALGADRRRFVSDGRSHLPTLLTSSIPKLAETAQAVAYLHARGIVHGDIKAANILISADHHVLLCDFGLSKLKDATTSTDQRGAGTLRWQSPEVLEGGPRTFESDVYAYGMTICEVRCHIFLLDMRRCLPQVHVRSSAASYHSSVSPVRPRCWLFSAENALPCNPSPLMMGPRTLRYGMWRPNAGVKTPKIDHLCKQYATP